MDTTDPPTETPAFALPSPTSSRPSTGTSPEPWLVLKVGDGEVVEGGEITFFTPDPSTLPTLPAYLGPPLRLVWPEDVSPLSGADKPGGGESLVADAAVAWGSRSGESPLDLQPLSAPDKPGV